MIISAFVTFLLLTLLQAVLGFDNLLYISLESRKAPEEKQASVRSWGIGIAIFLRIALLFILLQLISMFSTPVLTVGGTIDKTHVSADESTDESEVESSGDTEKDSDKEHDDGGHDSHGFTPTEGAWVSGSFNVHAIIVLLGGAFIIYTATKEVMHMMRLEHSGHDDDEKKSIGSVVFWIVVMNVVFSFDSILSAMALTNGAFGDQRIVEIVVMSAAIIAGGIMMIVLSDRVANFLKKNRMYEVLGLFVLFIVGIMLLTEGGHLAHLSFFGNEIMPMTKTTFYFVISVLVLTDIVQTRYQKKLLAEESHDSHA